MFLKNARTGRPQRAGLATSLLAAALLVGAPVVLAQQDGRGVNGRAQAATPGDIADHPDRYYGTRVQVRASTEDVYSPSWFTLDEDKLWSTGEDVLVVNPNPIAPVTPDDDVTVVGDVRMFTRATIEEEFDDWDWDVRPELIVVFERRPVLIAESIRTDDGRELVRNAAPLHDRMPATPRAPSGVIAAEEVDTGDLDDDLEKFLGRSVWLDSEVEKVISRSVFLLDDEVVVVAPNLTRVVTDDLDVRIVGEVARFDGDAIERLIPGYHFDLLPDVESQLHGRPVLIAQSVKTSDGQELMGRR